MKFVLLFLYSCMVSVTTGIASFSISLEWFSIREMLRSFSLDVIIFAVLLLLPPKLAFVVILLTFIPLLILSFMGVLHLAIYKSGISAFSVMSSLETSANEASEFLSEFVTLPHVAIGILVVAFSLLLLVKVIQANKHIQRNKWTFLTAILIIITCSWLVVIKDPRLLDSNPSWVIISSTWNHQRDLKIVNNFRDTRNSQSYDGIKMLGEQAGKETGKQQTEQNKTFIFIVGESSNRNHMSLYGYHRKTNPRLEKLAPEINTFSDVISSATHTIPSLRKTLLFHHNVEDESSLLLNSRSIVGLLGRAGFTTWWLSNQTGNSDGLTGIALLAADAMHKQFFNKARNEGNSISYDEVLLGALDNVLKNNEPQKAIFVHLIGSHLSYHLRYPKEFDYFTSTDDIADRPYRTARSKKYINQYDNSVRYTDYIVSQIIEKAKALDEVSFVVYFSDHGQEVYDTRSIKGQDPRNPSRHMYDIPFIIWLSNKYEKAYPQMADMIKKRETIPIPFILSSFADTAAGLCRVTFEGVTPSNDLFSPSYTPHKRSVLFGKDYDKLPVVTPE